MQQRSDLQKVHFLYKTFYLAGFCLVFQWIDPGFFSDKIESPVSLRTLFSSSSSTALTLSSASSSSSCWITQIWCKNLRIWKISPVRRASGETSEIFKIGSFSFSQRKAFLSVYPVIYISYKNNNGLLCQKKRVRLTNRSRGAAKKRKINRVQISKRIKSFDSFSLYLQYEKPGNRLLIFIKTFF
jgi:hypothetical protein